MKILLHLFAGANVLVMFLMPINARAAAGDLYLTDGPAGMIFKFTPAGVKSTFASGIDGPSGLAFDRTGDLFVAETGSGAILKFTPAGVKSTFANLDVPVGLAFDAAGNLFVADKCSGGVGCGSIFKISPAGIKTTFAHGQAFESLAFDGSGNLLAAEFDFNQTGRIDKFSPDGTSIYLNKFKYLLAGVFRENRACFTGGARSPHSRGPSLLRHELVQVDTRSLFAEGAGSPTGMAFGRSGNLFVSDFGSGTIFEFTPAGRGFVFTFEVEGPYGLAFDATGNLFAADSVSGMIFKFAPDASRTTFASGIGYPNFLAFEPVVEKLRNISARGLVGTGENVLIGGFLVGGNALANNAVIIRAIGPSLSRDGITNPLSDPMLELHNASGAVIATNDNWQDTQATQIRASHLAPTDPHEAAIYATLPAGAYTAIVRGVSSATGVAVVEVYSLAQ